MVLVRSPARLAAASVALVAWFFAPSAAAVDPPPPRFQTGGAALPSMPAPAEPSTLDVGVRFGAAARLGSGPSFPVTDRAGYMLGVGVAVAPSPRFSVGLAYEHSSLGAEQGTGDLGSVDVSRSLDALWLTVRLSVIRTPSFSLGLSLGPAVAWQGANASVLVVGGPNARPSAFNCAEGDGPGLGLRAGIGAEGRAGDHLVVSADTVLDNLRLSSGPLGTCVPGVGSVTMLGVRLGFAWRLDVSRVVR